MNDHSNIAFLLNKLEVELTLHGYWDKTSPSKTALKSLLPFSIDRLNCSQWLQWVFIPKTRQLMEEKNPFQSSVSISPYVEEAMRGRRGHKEITLLSKEIDAFFALSFSSLLKKSSSRL